MSGDADLTSTLASTLERRDGAAFVHVGSARSPAIRYCLGAANETMESPEPGTHAIAFDGSTWNHQYTPRLGASVSSRHPADELATELEDDGVSGTVLTPPTIPHDAALYLEGAGLALASSDALERARRTKSSGERDAIRAAQRAGSAGVERAAAILAAATTGGDGALIVEGDRITRDALRRAIDEAIVSAGAMPGGNSAIETNAAVVTADEPILVAVSPRVDGYHGGLVRTFVVDGGGGPRRRAHVALTRAFRSAQSFLTAGTQSVSAVEGDLEAEIRAFGFSNEEIEAQVCGIGLEPREAPATADADIGPGTVVRIEATIRPSSGDPIRLADLLAPGEPATWFPSPSRSLEPAAVLESE